MNVETYSKNFSHNGKSYNAVFIKRPFREGLEVSVEIEKDKVLRVGELGLGELALIERLKAEIERECAHS